MRITFKRSGGFAGISLSLNLDTLTSPPDQAKLIEHLVETAGFFDLPTLLPSPPGSADRFQYRLEIDSSGRQHAVDIGEAALPDSLRPLIDQLSTLARSAR
jgi:hypothetical protein